MRLRSTATLAALVIAFACSTNVVKAADDYDLKLTRPSKVGDKATHDVKMTSTMTRKTSMPDMPSLPTTKTPTLTKEQQDAINSAGVKIPGGFGGMIPSAAQKPAAAAAAPGGAAPEETVTVFKYTEEILEIDANGLPTKTSITVAELSKTSAGTTHPLLAPGTKLTKTQGAATTSTVTSVAGGAADMFSKNIGTGVKTGGHVVDTSSKFTADDSGISISREAQLALVTLSPSNHGHTADEMLGVSGKKKVGDSWPVNSQLFVDSLEGKEGAISVDQIKGTTTFTKVDDVDSVKCAILDAHVTISDIKPPNLPPSFTVKSATADITISGPVPLDATLPAMGRSSNTHVNIDAAASYSGHAAGMTIDMITKIDEKITPVK